MGLGILQSWLARLSLSVAKRTDSLKVKCHEKTFPEIFSLFSYQLVPVSRQFSGFTLSSFAKQGIPKLHSLQKCCDPEEKLEGSRPTQTFTDN